MNFWRHLGENILWQGRFDVRLGWSTFSEEKSDGRTDRLEKNSNNTEKWRQIIFKNFFNQPIRLNKFPKTGKHICVAGRFLKKNVSNKILLGKIVCKHLRLSGIQILRILSRFLWPSMSFKSLCTNFTKKWRTATERTVVVMSINIGQLALVILSTLDLDLIECISRIKKHQSSSRLPNLQLWMKRRPDRLVSPSWSKFEDDDDVSIGRDVCLSRPPSGLFSTRVEPVIHWNFTNWLTKRLILHGTGWKHISQFLICNSNKLCTADARSSKWYILTAYSMKLSSGLQYYYSSESKINALSSPVRNKSRG